MGPLSLDGQQIYRALSDADATAASAFLSGGLEPAAARRRYLTDIAAAARVAQTWQARACAFAARWRRSATPRTDESGCHVWPAEGWDSGCMRW